MICFQYLLPKWRRLENIVKSLDKIFEAYPDAGLIINSPEFYAMRESKRHGTTTTYDHCLRVAAGALAISRLLHCNRQRAIRAGLLHDLCTNDNRNNFIEKCHYLKRHPEEAADNARRLFGVSPEEYQAIRAHMFPLSLHFPGGRVAIAVSLADKGASIYEAFALRVRHT